MPDDRRRCWCRTYSCNGAWIKRGAQRSHEKADQRGKPAIIASAPRATLPAQVAEPLTRPAQDIEMSDASVPMLDLGGRRLRESHSAVEQDMLDNGTLSWSDIDLTAREDHALGLGPEPHPLGPIIQNPSVMIDYVNHYAALNSVASSSAQPLTATVAHAVPRDPAADMITKQLRAQIEEATNKDGGQDADGDLPPIDTLDPGAYIPPEDEEREVEDLDDDRVEWTEVGNPDIDDPDPFQTPPEQYGAFSSPDARPSHLLAIYAIASVAGTAARNGRVQGKHEHSIGCCFNKC